MFTRQDDRAGCFRPERGSAENLRKRRSAQHRAQQLRNQVVCRVGIGYAVAAVTLHVIDILFQTAKLRHTRQDRQEIAHLAVVDFNPCQRRGGFHQLGHHHQALDLIRNRASATRTPRSRKLHCTWTAYSSSQSFCVPRL